MVVSRLLEGKCFLLLNFLQVALLQAGVVLLRLWIYRIPVDFLQVALLQASVERLVGGWKVGPVDQLEASLYQWSVGESQDDLSFEDNP